MSGIPYIVPGAGSAKPLRAIDLDDRIVNEDWIQRVVFEHPDLLPISLIDPGFGPLIPLGREVPTSAGPIDALYISPDGSLTILEAKLWRNPQARREVVGQIIDYAAALSAWTVEDLDEVATSQGTDLWGLAKVESSFATENEFLDGVARNLRKGRFLLIIAGDGIREEVELMVDYVQAAPQLQFTIALVELKLYEHPDEQVLVIPSVVARTEEVTRAVVDVEVAKEARVHVEVAVPAEPSDERPSKEPLTETQLVDDLTRAVGEGLATYALKLKNYFESLDRFVVENKSARHVIKLRVPNSRTLLTVLIVQRSGSVFPGSSSQQIPRVGVSMEVGHTFVRDLAELTGARQKEEDPQWLVETIPLAAIQDNHDEVVDRILQYSDEIYAATKTPEAE